MKLSGAKGIAPLAFIVYRTILFYRVSDVAWCGHVNLRLWIWKICGGGGQAGEEITEQKTNGGE